MKYFSRLQNHLHKGTLSSLSPRKKNHLLCKVKELRARLYQLQPKLAGTVAAAALMGAFSLTPAMAQNPTFELKNSKNPFGTSVVSTLQTENRWTSPAAGDLDGDGDFDVVISTSSSFYYYENTGTNEEAVFTERTDDENPFSSYYDVSVDNSYPALVLFDLDGDGDLDLLAGGRFASYGQQITYYKNTGTSTSPAFVEQNGTDNPFPELSGYTGYGSPAIADIDGDGDADVFIADSEYGQMYFLENTGSATNPVFVGNSSSNPFPNTDISTDGSGGYLQPTFADLDGDGDLDAFMGQQDAEVLYFKNTGTATAPVMESQTGSDNPFSGYVYSWSAPVFVDLNDDGALDLILGYEDETKIHYNKGTATNPDFTQPLNFGEKGKIRLVDLNGDNKLDAVSSSREEGYWVKYAVNNGTASAPSFSLATTSENPFFHTISPRSNAFADIDGDNDIDFISSYDGGIYYENTGTSTSPEFVSNPEGNPFSSLSVIGDTYEFVDIDHDGDQDLVTSGSHQGDEYGYARYYKNTGTKTDAVFEEKTGIDNPFAEIIYRSDNYFTFVNFDGDADFDLVIGTEYEGIKYYQNTGTDVSPVFAEQTGSDNPFDFINTSTDPQNKYYGTAFMDADADGDLDLFVSEYDGSVKYYENTSSITTGLLGSNNSSSANAIIAFPNPVKDVLHYSIDNAKSSIIQVSVMDMTGLEVLNQSDANNGAAMTLNVSSLKSGVYILRVSSDSNISMTKFVKQ